MGHAIFISNKTNRYTFHSRSKVRKQSFSDRKWKSQNVSRNTTTPLTMQHTLALEWFSFSRGVWFALLIERRVGGRGAELMVIAMWASRVLDSHFIGENSCFGERNDTSRFPPDPAFSTTPGPRPRVFHLANKNRTSEVALKWLP